MRKKVDLLLHNKFTLLYWQEIVETNQKENKADKVSSIRLPAAAAIEPLITHA